jgi:hypothetical protein
MEIQQSIYGGQIYVIRKDADTLALVRRQVLSFLESVPFRLTLKKFFTNPISIIDVDGVLIDGFHLELGIEDGITVDAFDLGMFLRKQGLTVVTSISRPYEGMTLEGGDVDCLSPDEEDKALNQRLVYS